MATSEPLLPTPQASDGSQGAVIGKKDKFYMTKTGFPRKINQNGTDGSVGLPRLLQLISLQEVSPANHSHKLDEDKERQTTAIYGHKCLELYESSTQHGSSLRTCVASLLGTKVWYSNKCALIWKAKVTKYNRLLFQLSPSMRRIEGTGSGLLPTATVNEVEHKDMVITKTGRRATKDGKNSHSIGLMDKVAMLPTPRVGGDGAKGEKWIAKGNLHATVDGTDRGLKLQPSFALWMMGYPTDWCDLEAGEMPPSKQQVTQ